MWAADKPNVISFRVAVGRHVNTAWECVQWIGTKEKVDKNPGPPLSRLRTKVHEMLRPCRRPLVLYNIFADCLCHVLFRRYSPLSFEFVEKPNKRKKVLPPVLFGRTTPTLYGRLLARFTVHRLAKCGWVRLLISVCEAWQWNSKQNLRRVCKMQVQF